MRPGVARVDPVVFKDQRLVAVGLCPQGTALLLAAVHSRAALIVEAENGAAFASGLHRRRQLLLVAHASGCRGGFRKETRYGSEDGDRLNGRQSRLHPQCPFQHGRQRFIPFLRPPQDTQAGQSGQIVFEWG